MSDNFIVKKWQDHEGVVVASANGVDVIDCKTCEFKHIIPIPTKEELERFYQHEFYTEEKPLYADTCREDLEWWDAVYTHRFKILETHLLQHQHTVLDIGSGPGFFLLNGKKRGWDVKGIEPSIWAAEYGRSLGLDILNMFFTEQSASSLGKFDVINLGEVLEHIPNPADMLKLVHAQLNTGGLVCVIVPNDFNPLQVILRDDLGFNPWWVVPGHHLNYFNFVSLTSLLEKCGFEVLHQESTFPMEMFLLMGNNYVGNDVLGRQCHKYRMQFELNLLKSESNSLQFDLYSTFAKVGIGREIVFYARKNSH